MTTLLLRLYGWLLRLYPRAFRDDFGNEMRAVFADAVQDAAMRSTFALLAVCFSELRDLPGNLWHEYFSMLRNLAKEIRMSTVNANLGNTEPSFEKHTSWVEVLLGALPFALFGLVTLWIEGLKFFQMNLFPGHTIYLLFGCYALLVIGLGIGWVLGFPRWSYPYLAFVLVFSNYWETMTTPQFTFFGYTFHRNEFWAWRAWILPITMVIVALLVTRSLRPLWQLIKNIWHDWTLMTFAFYGTMPLLMWWLRDETRGLYPILHLAGSTLILTLGTIAYMRSTKPQQRVLTLLGTLTFSFIITIVGSSIYWDGQIEPWMRQPPDRWYEATAQGLVLLPLVLLVFFSPVIIGVLRLLIDMVRTA